MMRVLRALTDENSPATYSPLKKIINDTTKMIVRIVKIIGCVFLAVYTVSSQLHAQSHYTTGTLRAQWPDLAL
jgi:hypothetical protein